VIIPAAGKKLRSGVIPGVSATKKNYQWRKHNKQRKREGTATAHLAYDRIGSCEKKSDERRLY